MTQENFNNTYQADLQYCVLFNYLNKSENILPILDVINVEYDLFNNAITCEIQVTDPVSFLENFPIIGDETLVLGFKTPNLDINPTVSKFKNLLTFVFRIYRIEDRKQTANRASIYTLYGISSEGINNLRYSVNKTYYDWKGENVVQDIYDNYLKPSPIEYDLIKQVDSNVKGKKLKRLPSGENICLNFSNFRPLDAIKRVCFETQDVDKSFTAAKIKYKNNVSVNISGQRIPNIRITNPLGTARGMRNNNPGNIVSNRFTQQYGGYIDSDGRFAIFASPEDGIRAMDRLLGVYNKKYGLNTVSGIVNRWAPPNENQTGRYVNFVSKETGFAPDQKIDFNNKEQRAKLIKAIIYQENGKNQGSLFDDRVLPALNGVTSTDTATFEEEIGDEDPIPNIAINQPPKKEYTVDITERTKKTKSSNFIFYENDDGWNFVTIDHLLYRDRSLVDAGGLVQDFYFLDSRVDPSKNKSIFGKNVRQDQRILELDFVRQMDNAENMDRGLYSSTLVSLDPLTKRIEFDPFIYDRDYKDIAHLETDLDGPQRVGIFTENSLFIEKNVNNHRTKCDEFQHRNYVITNLGPEYDESDGLFKGARLRDHQIRNPKKFHEFLKYDYASKVQFNNIIIDLNIPGNSDIQIGHMINLNVLSNNINDSEQKILYNRLFGNENLGGFFLVTKVKHSITIKDKSYVTYLQCVKDTYATTKFRDNTAESRKNEEIAVQRKNQEFNKTTFSSDFG
jgi:hypothetical protein